MLQSFNIITEVEIFIWLNYSLLYLLMSNLHQLKRMWILFVYFYHRMSGLFTTNVSQNLLQTCPTVLTSWTSFTIKAPSPCILFVAKRDVLVWSHILKKSEVSSSFVFLQTFTQLHFFCATRGVAPWMPLKRTESLVHFSSDFNFETWRLQLSFIYSLPTGCGKSRSLNRKSN